MRDIVATEPLTESLAEILQRIEARYIHPSSPPSAPQQMDRKYKSPFAPAGVGTAAPSASRHGALEAGGED